MNEAKQRNISWVALIGAKTILDISTKKYFDDKYLRVHLLNEGVFPNNYYVNCFGNIIIEVWLDQKIADEIDLLYKTATEDNEIIKAKLSVIMERRNTKNKMRISRNTPKAEKIRKIFRKYFIGI